MMDKRHFPMDWWLIGRHPRIRLAMVCVSKGGGSANDEEKGKYQWKTLSNDYKLCLTWFMISFSIPFADIDIHHSQNYIFITSDSFKIKGSSTFVIPVSLCEGPILWLLCWVSRPIPLCLKQAFELLWSNHLYVHLLNHVLYSSLFSTTLLSKWI